MGPLGTAVAGSVAFAVAEAVGGAAILLAGGPPEPQAPAASDTTASRARGPRGTMPASLEADLAPRLVFRHPPRSTLPPADRGGTPFLSFRTPPHRTVPT